MGCEICEMNLSVGETVELLCEFICYVCSNSVTITQPSSTYLGLNTKNHVFKMAHPKPCTVCGTNLTHANIPCGDTYSDVLFSFISKPEPAVPDPQALT